ncbi:MAG: TlpA family protein disulfide reductase [Rudaea sp.]
MSSRANLLIVLVAIVGAALGLFVSTRMDRFVAVPVPSGVDVLKLGDTRLDLELTDISGTPRHLGEWDGKLVLLNFWASWCGPCREEMPLLDATRTKLAGKDLEVVGIAIDETRAVQDFLKDNPVHYPILIGNEDDDASLRFGDTRGVLPYSVLIGRDGKLLARRAGSFSESSLAHWLEPYL